jgi:hypothetical protein
MVTAEVVYIAIGGRHSGGVFFSNPSELVSAILMDS